MTLAPEGFIVLILTVPRREEKTLDVGDGD